MTLTSSNEAIKGLSWEETANLKGRSMGPQERRDDGGERGVEEMGEGGFLKNFGGVFCTSWVRALLAGGGAKAIPLVALVSL